MFRLILIALFLLGSVYYLFQGNYIEKFHDYITIKHTMKLTSSAFTNNNPIPSVYTCDGEATNPPLSIADTPGTAQSLVLIVDDPDAPMGTWTHWVLFNMLPNTLEIPAKSVPVNAIQGKAGSGNVGYDAPCPPPASQGENGMHRYMFKLYALDNMLSLQEGASQKDVEAAMQGHILDETQLTGLYSKNQ